MKFLFLILVLVSLSGCGESYGPDAYGVKADMTVAYGADWSTADNEFLKDPVVDDTSKLKITFNDEVVGLHSLTVVLDQTLKDNGYSYVYVQNKVGINIVAEISFTKTVLGVTSNINTDDGDLRASTITVTSFLAIKY